MTLGSLTHSFDSVPEYKSVWDDQSTSYFLDRYDSEYRSDYLHYQYPVEFEKSWITEDDILQTTVGSLGKKEFLIEQRLKVARPLKGPIDFQIVYFQESDWEEDVNRFNWQFGFNRGALRFSVFGNAQFKKEGNDAGLSADYSRDENSTDRFGIMLVDFDRNERAQEDTKWRRRPYTLSLSGHRLAGGEDQSFYKYYLRAEPKSTLSDGDAEYDYSRNSNSVGFIGAIARNPDRGYEYRFHYDEKKELNEPAAGLGNPSSVYETERLMLSFARKQVFSDKVLTLGLAAFHLGINQGDAVSEFSDVLPFLWWKYGIWSVGADASWQHLRDEAKILENDDDNQVEGRLNIKIDQEFSGSGGFAFLFTFDLDRLGSRESWEGGAGQLALDF